MWLAKEIAHSRNKYPISEHFRVVDELIRRDEEETGFEHGQQSRDSFHRADVFVDTRDAEQLNQSVSRFIELLFGNTFHTPTKSEYGMFVAHAAALRSAELSRQVGSSIIDAEGEVLAVGCNEVPKAGGGVYWCGDKPDKREFQDGVDSSDEQKRNMISETLGFLKNAGWLTGSKENLDDAELLNLAIGPTNPALPKEAKIRNVIEYGRAVHAEMAALTNAARKGIEIAGCTMNVTTFPCHLCARHIVSAGITRVVYVEPYPKSMTAELYLDSISVDGQSSDPKHVPFDVFVGVAPLQYQNLFTAGIRKDKNGKAIKFTKSTARLRYYQLSDVYKENEITEFKALTTVMRNKGIIKTGD
ncbi:MAG: deaminase [Candidatus Korobacteraceae bacterium]